MDTLSITVPLSERLESSNCLCSSDGERPQRISYEGANLSPVPMLYTLGQNPVRGI